ncbi:DNA-formamidopyrimidine glycosylase family protein, partial [Streptomyces benahoarensis]|uniref:DNA-formamidopyrimidine glycosylase family protein n=2 Tax=Streptomyces TaxID=1883 RepID=UPI002556FC08
MPELPEVESLVRYLRGRVGGRTVDRVFPVAVSVLKTYEPAVTELEGRVCGDVVR